MKNIFIIAEAGVNHNGSIEIARELVAAATEAGADAVKFQTFQADEMAGPETPLAAYQASGVEAGVSQYEMLKELELGESDYKKIISYCEKKKIQFLSSPFDLTSLELLCGRFKLPLIKIASGELTHAPLLLRAGHAGVNCIVSTGMSSIDEIRQALSVLGFGYLYPHREPDGCEHLAREFSGEKLKQKLQKHVTLLHCVSGYPAPVSECNLNALQTLRETFDLPVGFSDHSKGFVISIAAVALGVCMIEKHLTLDKTMKGPDHSFSLEPKEFKDMVNAVRDTRNALGTGVKKPRDSEIENIGVSRKSLVALQGVSKGDVFTPENLGCKRPGLGISPFEYWDYIGKNSDRDYLSGEMIKP